MPDQCVSEYQDIYETENILGQVLNRELPQERIELAVEHSVCGGKQGRENSQDRQSNHQAPDEGPNAGSLARAS